MRLRKLVFSEKLLHICPILVFLQVTSNGQIIGAIVAIDQSTAQAAAKMVKVEYENIEPAIISIEVSYLPYADTKEDSFVCS